MPETASSLAYLFSLEQFGVKLGLDNIRTLCEALDHPEDDITPLIIAGTNGKGSVAAMVETALRSAGYSHGLFHLSPFDQDRRAVRHQRCAGFGGDLGG